MAGRFFGPVRWKFTGKRRIAAQCTGIARALLGQLEEAMGFAQLKQLRHQWRLGGGVVVTALSVHGMRIVEIYAPEGTSSYQSGCLPEFIMDSGIAHMTGRDTDQAFPLQVCLTGPIKAHRSSGVAIDKADLPDPGGVGKTQTYVFLPPARIPADATDAEKAALQDKLTIEQYGVFYDAIYPVCPGFVFTKPNQPPLTDNHYYESPIVTAPEWALQGRETLTVNTKAAPAYRWSGFMRLFVQAKNGVGARIEGDPTKPGYDFRFTPDKAGLIFSEDYEVYYLSFIEYHAPNQVILYRMAPLGIARSTFELMRHPSIANDDKVKLLAYVFSRLEFTGDVQTLSLDQTLDGQPFGFGWHWSYTENKAAIVMRTTQFTGDNWDFNYWDTRQYELTFDIATSRDPVTGDVTATPSVSVATLGEGHFSTGLYQNFWVPAGFVPGMGKLLQLVYPPDSSVRVPIGAAAPIYCFYAASGLKTLTFSETPAETAPAYDDTASLGQCGGIPQGGTVWRTVYNVQKLQHGRFTLGDFTAEGVRRGGNAVIQFRWTVASRSCGSGISSFDPWTQASVGACAFSGPTYNSGVVVQTSGCFTAGVEIVEGDMDGSQSTVSAVLSFDNPDTVLLLGSEYWGADGDQGVSVYNPTNQGPSDFTVIRDPNWSPSYGGPPGYPIGATASRWVAPWYNSGAPPDSTYTEPEVDSPPLIDVTNGYIATVHSNDATDLTADRGTYSPYLQVFGRYDGILSPYFNVEETFNGAARYYRNGEAETKVLVDYDDQDDTNPMYPLGWA